jgi:hypothetical protein
MILLVQKTRSIRRNAGKFVFGWACFCLLSSHIGVSAAPVDLTPPRNSLGYSDKDGKFRIVERFGQLRFTNDFVIPLRFEFWTGRNGEEDSLFGWDGWHCGPLESTVKPYGGDRILEITLLCAKRLYLERDATEPTLFYTTDREWIGKADGDRFQVSRADGWELTFQKEKVASLRTDQGAMIRWVRDETGTLLKIAEDGVERPALEVQWKGNDPASGLVDALVMPDRTIEVEVRPDRKTDRSLFRVTWPEGAALQEMSMERSAASLDMVKHLGAVRRFEWDAETGRILSDGINSYDVDFGANGSATIRMVNASGEEQTRRYDKETHAVTVSRSDGFVSTLYRVADAKPGASGIERIDIGEGDKIKVALRNHYDSSGRIVRREWSGDPAGLTGYRGGKIETALNPDPEVVYSVTDGTAFSPEAPLAMVTFDYDDEGRHVASSVAGIVALKIDYASNGKVARAERTGRFVRTYEYTDDKVTETLQLAGLAAGPYGFIESGDPDLTEDVVVRRETIPDGPVLLEVYLDGSSRRFSYDQNGRYLSEERYGKDASQPALSIQYVYSPDGAKVGEIEDNRLTGKTSYFQRSIRTDGLWDRREKVARLEFP